MFFIQFNDPANLPFMNKLIELGEIVNQRNSTKQDYLNYMRLKNGVIFTEDIYKMNDIIYTENSFKESHPLLFVHINEVLQHDYTIMEESKLVKKIQTKYVNLIEERNADKMKALGDSETLADRFKMIEKDMYYGYAITAHKSQGSTYENVVVDEMDFQKISNKWNYKYDKMEMRIKEKNQLRYVAYTRAKTNLFLLYNFGSSSGPGLDDTEAEEVEMDEEE